MDGYVLSFCFTFCRSYDSPTYEFAHQGSRRRGGIFAGQRGLSRPVLSGSGKSAFICFPKKILDHFHSVLDVSGSHVHIRQDGERVYGNDRLGTLMVMAKSPAHVNEVAREISRMLIEGLEKEDHPAEYKEIPLEFVWRESAG